MRIVEMKERNSELIENLLDVWENSVKATHLFLSDDEINNIITMSRLLYYLDSISSLNKKLSID